MHSEAQIRALDVCIQKMQMGEKLEQALELYPQWSSDIVPPLEAVQVLRVYAESLQNSTSIQSQDRASFLEAAQKIKPKSGLASFFRVWLSRLTFFVLIVLVIYGALWGTATVSAALPGERFYQIKEIYRQARLLVANHTVRRLELELAYDQARLEEVQSLAALEAQADVTFAGLFQQPQKESWTVGEIPIELPSQVQIVGKVTEDTWVEVTGRHQKDGSVLVSQIRPREYTFEGILDEISPQTLSISGVPVNLGNETLVHGSPMAGSQVRVVVFRTADNGLLARLVDATE